MSIAQSLLAELDYEAAMTATTLGLVPDGQADFRPHPKSFSLGQLAAHICDIPHWGLTTLETDEYDVAPADGGPGYTPAQFAGTAATVAAFNEGLAGFRAALAAATDEQLLSPWSLKAGGETKMTLPRVGCLRSFIMNHLIHHRAQLGVYLRLLDVPLPATYGPSADDSGGM